jgi:hypothetical protein
MHLMVGTPCYGGVVTQRYMQSVCGLIDYANVKGIAVSVELLGYDSLITRSRNTIVSTFLDSPATHLMFIDADIGFSAAQVDRMLAFDQDVVAGMYPLKIVHYDESVLTHINAGETLESAQIRYVGALEPDGRREEIDGFSTGEFAGAGFLLMKRQALSRLIAAYPQTRYTAAHNQAALNPSANKFALFDCMIEPETGHYLSEDYTFCYRWRATGGKLWLDTRSQLMHVGPREFVGDAGPRFARAG